MNDLDERQVFLALKGIFVGANAEAWKRKKIKCLIERHKTEQELRLILDQHDIQKVSKVAQALLQKGVFASTQHASRYLSGTISTIPERPAQETPAINVSNTEPRQASNSTQDVLQDIIDGFEGPSGEAHQSSQGSEAGCRQVTHSRDGIQPSSETVPDPSVHRSRTIVPSLYPIYLPLPTQLRLMRQTQDVLEKSLYAFAASRLKNVLRTKGWDCSDCVELNIWSHLLSTQKIPIFDQKLPTLRKPWSNVLKSLAEIRHAAVHRMKLPVEKTIDLLLDAESLLNVLKDDTAQNKLASLRRNTEEVVEKIQQNQDHLESRVSTVLQGFIAQKAQIERLEQVAIEEVLKDDKTYRDASCAALDQATLEVANRVRPTQSNEQQDSPEEYYDAEEFTTTQAGTA